MKKKNKMKIDTLRNFVISLIVSFFIGVLYFVYLIVSDITWRSSTSSIVATISAILIFLYLNSRDKK